MAERFTKGPWTIDRLPHRRVYLPEDVEILCPQHAVIATLYRENRGGVGEDAANARLIAAAPELYALVERAGAVITSDWKSEHPGVWLQEARALLARIQGEG